MKKIYSLLSAAMFVSCGFVQAVAAEAPIQTLPEGGKTTLYSRSGGCYYAYLGNQYSTRTYDYQPAEIVEYDNGDVYLKNIFSQYDYTYYNEHSYIKGHRDGSVITFQFPQMVITQTWGSSVYEYYASMVEYSEAKRIFVPVADDKNTYSITVKDDGSIEAEIIGNGMTFPGMIDQDNDWTYYGEVFSTWTPMTDVAVAPPASLQTEEMALTSGENGYYVNVGFNGDDVYIQGAFSMDPEVWIKGHREGAKVSFESGQYLGFSPSGDYFAYFMAAEFESQYSEEDNGDVRVLKPRERFTFDYDDAAKTFTSADGYVLVYNKNPEYIDYMDYVEAPVIRANPADMSKNPRAAWNVGYYKPIQPWDPVDNVSFNVSKMNEDNYLLDSSKLYYRIFFGEEAHTFTKKNYYKLPSDMEFIPVDFTDGSSFHVMDAARLIYIYDAVDVTTVGVQMYYIEGEACEDNIVAQSAIVRTETSSVDQTFAMKSVANITYYDMTGRVVADPQSGVYVKVVTYTDGTTETTKIRK